MIPILLTVIPAIMMALGVVRKKELSSITNLYVTPVTHLEFLLGTSTLARLMPQLGLLVILCILPLLLLSAGTSPRESMPPLAQSIMLGALTLISSAWRRVIPALT